jgi:RimJ/RimL family protein N-acetyltransferase
VIGELLRTPRLIVRRLTLGDGPRIVELDSDPEVVRYVGMPSREATTLARWRAVLWPKTLAWYERGSEYGFWAVHTRDDENFIGWFHYRPHDDISPDDPELGYRFARGAWGKGYATEGGEALVERGFSEVGDRRIYARAERPNVASWRVMEKLGMCYERLVIQPDGIREVRYAIGRDAWQSRRSP